MKTLLCLIAFFISCSNLAYAQVDSTEVVESVEKLPEPTGGWPAFYQFLGEEIKYPKANREAGIEGKVVVRFIIETDGSVTGIDLVPGAEDLATHAMIKETMRVMELSPKWKPGIQGGSPVRCKYTLPVKFSLGKKAKKSRRLRKKSN